MRWRAGRAAGGKHPWPRLKGSDVLYETRFGGWNDDKKCGGEIGKVARHLFTQRDLMVVMDCGVVGAQQGKKLGGMKSEIREEKSILKNGSKQARRRANDVGCT